MARKSEYTIRYNFCFRCGRKFEPMRSDQKYCSRRCRLLEYREMSKASRENDKQSKLAENTDKAGTED